MCSLRCSSYLIRFLREEMCCAVLCRPRSCRVFVVAFPAYDEIPPVRNPGATVSGVAQQGCSRLYCVAPDAVAVVSWFRVNVTLSKIKLQPWWRQLCLGITPSRPFSSPSHSNTIQSSLLINCKCDAIMTVILISIAIMTGIFNSPLKLHSQMCT